MMQMIASGAGLYNGHLIVGYNPLCVESPKIYCQFQSVCSINRELSKTSIKKNNNHVNFFDADIQTQKTFKYMFNGIANKKAIKLNFLDT